MTETLRNIGGGGGGVSADRRHKTCRGFGGMLPQKIFKIWIPEMAFAVFLRAHFVRNLYMFISSVQCGMLML